MQQDSPVVVTDKLTKKYDELTALDEVSISLNRGEILGIIGPNGAGKTTMIKILVGLARPTSGMVRIAGADCMRDASKIKHLVGYMPDKFGSYDNMRVREYLDFFGAAFGLRRKERKKRIEAVLDTTDATYMQDRFVETLSYGMQQRIGIARTLLHDPEVLIFDEPANGLDPQARVDMRNLLLQLAQMGKTLIVTSHILPELSRICDQVAILTHGKLRAFGTLEDIMSLVSQKRVIETQLTTADQIEEAITIIRQSVETDAEITGSAAEAIVRFQTSRSDSELSELLAKLVTAGIHVSQFRELQTSLEDAFLSVTQNDDRQASAASTSAEVVQTGSASGGAG
ncbi:MAG: ABC transporter ATP-binding protein [Planctomycetes bacterium]|nr:ABC transporter ATP-binding protein [Planctomycetota bacterium]